MPRRRGRPALWALDGYDPDLPTLLKMLEVAQEMLEADSEHPFEPYALARIVAGDNNRQKLGNKLNAWLIATEAREPLDLKRAIKMARRVIGWQSAGAGKGSVGASLLRQAEAIIAANKE
jgi:hypothetical protein